MRTIQVQSMICEGEENSQALRDRQCTSIQGKASLKLPASIALLE